MNCLDSLVAFAASPEGAATGSFLSGIAAWFAILAGIVGGIIGFKAWLREHRGKSQYEIAKRVLLAAYQLREAINATRAATVFRIQVGDGTTRAWNTHGTVSPTAPITFQLHDAYLVRLKHLTDVRAHVVLVEWEAVAIFGPEVSRAFEPLYNLVVRLITGADVYFELETRRIDNGEPRDPALVGMHRELYQTKTEDEVSRLLAEAIAGMELRFRPYLR